jgi:hypothetical protein
MKYQAAVKIIKETKLRARIRRPEQDGSYPAVPGHFE